MLLAEARSIYSTRKEEVSLFLSALVGIDDDQELKNKFQPDVLKIFKAQGYLLLYNAVEAITSYAAKNLYEALSQKNIDIRNMPIGLKMTTFELLRSIKDNSYKNFKDDLKTSPPDDLNKSMMTHCYQIPKDKDSNLVFFSGNVDARVIRSFFERFGFEITLTDECQGGSSLLQIKSKRNHLAHGSISFVDEGKTIAIDELLSLNERTFKYLECLINSVEGFLSSLDS